MDRREFIAGIGATTVSGCVSSQTAVRRTEPAFLRAGLYHFGSHMWDDARVDDPLLLDCGEWRKITDEMVRSGLNALVIDLGEGIVYPSHPELAVGGSWAVDRFRRELDRLRAAGLEVVPKLNFSAAHDAWLKDYGRMVSTPTYYRVCADLIRDVDAIFDHPRFFHMGYDEERERMQRKFQCCVVRQGELWWHDFLWFVREIERTGMRPWMWSDYMWKKDHEGEFLRRTPKSVLQSNWYYGSTFDADAAEAYAKAHPDDWWHDGARVWIAAYEKLDKAGFDQVPTCSNFGNDANIAATVAYCRSHLDTPRLKGVMVAPWFMTEARNREKNLFGARELGRALADFRKE